MEQVSRRDQLLAELHSGSNDAVVDSAKALLTLGEYGTPAGAYPLAGGKAAFRSGRLADAVVLLYHGLRVAEPMTTLWAEILVQRAMACSHHGLWLDSVTAAQTYLESLPNLPAEAAKWEPFAHHALGLSFDRLRRYAEAVPHHHYALDLYTDPTRRTHATCDLAYSLALSGSPVDAEAVMVPLASEDLSGLELFGYLGTKSIVWYHLGRFSDALDLGDQAISVAADQRLAIPIAEVGYWMSRSAWAIGDRFRAGTLALHVAVSADRHWDLALRDTANNWLAEIMEQGLGDVDDAVMHVLERYLPRTAIKAGNGLSRAMNQNLRSYDQIPLIIVRTVRYLAGLEDVFDYSGSVRVHTQDIYQTLMDMYDDWVEQVPRLGRRSEHEIYAERLLEGIKTGEMPPEPQGKGTVTFDRTPLLPYHQFTAAWTIARRIGVIEGRGEIGLSRGLLARLKQTVKSGR